MTDPSDTGSFHLATDLLALRAERTPEDVAFGVADIDAAGTGVRVNDELTFREWYTQARCAARALAARGAGHLCRVALLYGQQEWVDYAVAYTATLLVGGTAVHLDPGLSRAALVQRMREAEATLLIHGDEVDVPERAVAPRLSVRELVGEGRNAPDVPRPPIRPTDPADVLWTSGTTGPAKAFVNPHGTLTYGRGPEGLARLDTRVATVAPMPMGTASSAMCVGMLPLMTPSRLLLCAPHDVDAIGQLVEQYHASTILLTPWSAMRLVQNGVPERYDLTSLRTLAFASAALPACTARSLLAASPEASITTAYAQGEAVPAVVLGVFDPDRPLCLGREANGTAIRIVDEQRRELPDGELGEIVMFSSAPKRLYLDDERNRVTHVDGWTYTRDLGRREGDGTITLFDRIADVIHAESGPVSSLAIEQALYDHPDIVEVAVVGIGEPDHQQIAAFVVRRPGGARLADLRGFAEHRLEVGHRPTVWRFPRTLPRGVTGKVSKLSLRNRLTDLGIAHDRRRVSA